MDPEPILGESGEKTQRVPVRFTGRRFALLVFFLVALILFGGLMIFRWYTPKAQAQVFLKETAADFQALQAQLDHYEGGFVSTAHSFDVSKGAFYEISVMRTYDDSVKDTAQDVADITDTLKKIDEAKRTLDTLDTPKELQSLADSLRAYYDKAETGLKLLLEHEQLQQKLLAASGDELNQTLGRLNKLLTTDKHTQGELTYYFGQVAVQIRDAIDRMEPLVTPQTPENAIFIPTYVHHLELFDIFSYCAQQFSKNTTADNQACYDKLTVYTKNYELERARRKVQAQEWMDHSPIKANFEEAVKLEEQIGQQFKDKGVLPTPSPSPDASPGASESASPSATVSE